jgi:hypothetical protein
MKSIVHILFILLIPFCSGAQITLTAATTNPVPGDTCYYYTVGSGNPGNNGANAVWDFSQLPTTDKQMIRFDLPINFGCNPTYSPNTIGAVGMSLCWYYNTSSDSFSRSGYYRSFSTTKYSDDEVFLRYPLTYNAQVYTDTFKQRHSAPNSSTNIRGYQTIEADAYGTLILPDTTYSNTLRVKRTIISYATYESYGIPPHTITTGKELYAWYVADIHMPLLELGKSIPVPEEHDTTTTEPEPGPGNEPEPVDVSIKVYPNPVTTSLNISCPDIEDPVKKVTVYDINGKILFQQNEAGKQEYTIDVTQLQTGIYFVKIDALKGTIRKKFLVQ